MKRRDDPNQTLINWGNPQAPVIPAVPNFPDPVKLAAGAPTPLIQILPWDFCTSFPQPTDAAIDAGIVQDTDVLPENLKSLHDNYARQCIATLEQLDKVMDDRRMGLDPNTGKPPTTHAGRERLRKLEPDRLQHAFHVLIETYENAFGVEAAEAFRKCIVARHAGVPVQASNGQAPEPAEGKHTPLIKRRAPTVLPVPKPLPAAISRGDFGQDDGKPVNPTPAEVRAITENHAEKIIDLLDGIRELERQLTRCSDVARVGAECNRLKNQVTSAIEEYAASFGAEAGERLEAYCRRQQKVSAMAR